MPGFGLEAFKFSMYLGFPIGFMYYFGTNLDNRFSIQGFWPKPEECNKLPRDREELEAEYHRLVAVNKLRQERIEAAERRKAESQN